MEDATAEPNLLRNDCPPTQARVSATLRSELLNFNELKALVAEEITPGVLDKVRISAVSGEYQAIGGRLELGFATNGTLL